MPETERYEILVIGSREAGKYLTWTMAQEGRQRQWWSGSTSADRVRTSPACPAKNVIRSAKAAWFAWHAADYGVQTGRCRRI